MCCPNCCGAEAKEARYEFVLRGDTLVAMLKQVKRKRGEGSVKRYVGDRPEPTVPSPGRRERA